MSADVLQFTGLTTLDEPPEQLLDKAKSWGLVRCIVIGETEDGDVIWEGSFSDTPLVNWLLDCCKAELLERPKG